MLVAETQKHVLGIAADSDYEKIITSHQNPRSVRPPLNKSTVNRAALRIQRAARSLRTRCTCTQSPVVEIVGSIESATHPSLKHCIKLPDLPQPSSDKQNNQDPSPPPLFLPIAFSLYDFPDVQVSDFSVPGNWGRFSLLHTWCGVAGSSP